MPSVLSARKNNKGLTVKINLWALEKYLDKFNSKMARYGSSDR